MEPRKLNDQRAVKQSEYELLMIRFDSTVDFSLRTGSRWHLDIDLDRRGWDLTMGSASSAAAAALLHIHDATDNNKHASKRRSTTPAFAYYYTKHFV